VLLRDGEVRVLSPKGLLPRRAGFLFFPYASLLGVPSVNWPRGFLSWRNGAISFSKRLPEGRLFPRGAGRSSREKRVPSAKREGDFASKR